MHGSNIKQSANRHQKPAKRGRVREKKERQRPRPSRKDVLDNIVGLLEPKEKEKDKDEKSDSSPPLQAKPDWVLAADADFEKGVYYIPEEVNKARKSGQTVLLYCPKDQQQCFWYWEMPDGSKINCLV